MAEIFATNGSVQLPPMMGAEQAKLKTYTGVSDVDTYINSLPENEREEAVKFITAPKTGEEIWKDMLAADTAYEKSGGDEKYVYDPSKEDWAKLKDFQRTVDNDNLELLTKAGSHIYELFTNGMAGAIKEPEKMPRSLVEAFAQGTNNLYGIAAMSQDSTSPQAAFFRAIQGYEEDSDAAYREFLRARNFVREQGLLASGKKTMVMDKNHINHDFVQAASLVADPTLFIPFAGAAGKVARLVGMGEKALLAAAKVEALKARIVGGTLKYVVGAPIEMFGNATRNTIDFGVSKAGNMFEATVGVSSKEFDEFIKPAMKIGGVTSIGAGALGYSIPTAASVSGAYVLGNVASGAGMAISAVGEQMFKGPRGLATYASEALRMSMKEGVELTPQAKAFLKFIDKMDPLFEYGGTIASGSYKGAVIGGGLGYWSGGRDGMWSGIGAGIALGSIGASVGKFTSDIAGGTRKMRTAITAKYELEAIKEFNPQQGMHWDNVQTWAKANGSSIDGLLASRSRVHPKSEVEIYNNEMYDRYLRTRNLDPNADFDVVIRDGEYILDKRTFNQHNGYVIENMADGRVKIVINADTAGRPTIGHELYHSVLRTSALKDFYVRQIRDGVLGVRDTQGNLTTRPVISLDEMKAFSRRYIKAEYKDPDKYADAMARLEVAEREFESNGNLILDEMGRPFLEKLAEEFGAYYFSHLINDKPVDWLFYGGELPGIRGLLESAGSSWLKYWKSRVKEAVPEFNFDRTYTDPATGIEKPVTIDQVFAPLRKTLLGKAKSAIGMALDPNIDLVAERVINPALDGLMKDMLRVERAVNETGNFDIGKLSRDAQKALIDGNGLDGLFERKIDGSYKIKSQAQIRRENRLKGKEVYKLLMGVPADKRTFRVDADGSIRGPFSDEILDNIVASGHMTKEMANKIRLFQNIASKNVDYNVVDFGGIGATMETIGDASNPPRIRGAAVPFKQRTGIVFGIDIKISPKGEFEFNGNMLDYTNIMTRGNNVWSDLAVQRLWNGNHTDFMTDLFRYLENASKDVSDPTRVPSAQLWTDNLGGERRNALHQVMGMAKAEADVYLNPPTGEIARNHLSTVMTFSLNRMTNLRLRDQKVPFEFKNAYNDIKRNFHPREHEGEPTPKGMNWNLPNGYRFIKYDDDIRVFNDSGKQIGKVKTLDDAERIAKKHAAENPPMVLNNPILREAEFGTVQDLRRYAAQRGFNLSGYRHVSPVAGITQFDVNAPAINRSSNPAGIYFRSVSQGTYEGGTAAGQKLTNYDAVLSLHNPYKLGGENRFPETMWESLADQVRKMYKGRSQETIDYKIQEYTAAAKRNGRLSNEWFKDGYDMRDFLIKHGYDGISDGSDVAVFYPEQIKSEAKITHDNLGNPIPKAERFDRRSPDIRRSPNESYEGGDNYWKPKENIFERRDEQGMLIRDSVVRNKSTGFKSVKNPDALTWIDIGHAWKEGTFKGVAEFFPKNVREAIMRTRGSQKSGEDIPLKDVWATEFAGKWAINRKGGIEIAYDSNGKPQHVGYTHDEWFSSKTGGDTIGEFGRYEKPVYDENGNLLRRGRMSITNYGYTNLRSKNEPIKNIRDARKLKNDLAKKLNLNPEDIDAYLFFPSEELKQSLGLSRQDKLPVKFSPSEGRGEEAVFSTAIPREAPRFRDSFRPYEQFGLPQGADPFPFRDINEFDRDFFGKAIKLDPTVVPEPSKDTFYSFLRWHMEFNKTLTMRKALEFLVEQGRSVHSNVARSYYSQWAQTLLALAPKSSLDRYLTVHGKDESYASSVEIVLGMKHTRQVKYREKPEKGPFSLTEEDLGRIEEQEAEAKKKKEEGEEEVEIEEDTEFGRKEDLPPSVVIEGAEKKKQRFRYVEEYPSMAHGDETYLNLELLIDRMFEKERSYPRFDVRGDPTKGTDVTYVKTREADRLRYAMMGRSFEGVALEEIGHAIEDTIATEAIANDSTGILKKIYHSPIKGDASSVGETGVAWKRLVDQFIDVHEKKIANGMGDSIPPPVLAYARLYKLLRHIAKNIDIVREKDGQVTSLWDNDKVVWNKPTNQLTDKGVKLLKDRGLLPKGYKLVGPRQGTMGNLDPSTRSNPTPAKLFTTENAYRFIQTPEFVITLFNTPDVMAWLASIKPDPSVLETLDTPWIQKGFSPNVASLHNQMSYAVGRFLGTGSNPHFSINNILAEEVIRIYDLNRKGRNNLDMTSDSTAVDIKPVNLETQRGNWDYFLPERPKGFLTPYEKQYIGNHRVALREWAKANKGENFLEGKTDWEAWELLKDVPSNPEYFNWYLESQRNIREIKESEAIGVKLPKGMLEEEGSALTVPREVADDLGLRYDPESVVTTAESKETGWGETQETVTVREGELTPEQIAELEKQKQEGTTVRRPPPDVPPDLPPPETTQQQPKKDKKDKTSPTQQTQTGQAPVAQMPPRNLTKADFRMWTDYIPEYQSNTSFTLRNGMGYTIMFLGNNYRVYNPQRALMGIYKSEDDAKRRIERERSRVR